MQQSHQALLAFWIEQADAVERSWSFGAHHDAERALLFFDNQPELVDALADTAQRLGLPQSMIAQWRVASDRADALGLAFQRDFQSIRLYVQHWDVVVSELPSPRHPLYQGFKGLPDGSTRIDQYRVLPLVDATHYGPRIRDHLQPLGAPSDLLDVLIQTVHAEQMIWTEISSPLRTSWLATVRRAEIPLHYGAQLVRALMPDREDLWRHAKSHRLIHLAGGQDTTKQGFTTVYFEDSAEALLARLNHTPSTRP